MIVDRVAIVLALIVCVGLAMLVARAWSARRTRAVLATDRGSLWRSLGELPDGRTPALVTFSTPSCAACHQAQAPAVRAVEQQRGDAAVRIISVDSSVRPDVARAFGVMTVPSTVVMGAAGEVVAVNQGFAPTSKLVEQLQRA